MRGPRFPRGVTRRATVATVDLAPTVVDLAGLRPTVPMDGRSLLPVARGEGQGWQSLLIQAGPRFGEGDGSRWFFRGVRTPRYTYVDYPRYGTELYDRRRDPHQLRNVAGAAAYAAVREELGRRLEALETCSGASCQRDFGPVPRRSDPLRPGAARTPGP
jgi:N-acetylglucosamine-6-sulfatase